MVKQGGMVSDGECDDAEREALAKGPTVPQKGLKGKLVSIYTIVSNSQSSSQ
jgi:hypothetical protein